MMANTFHVSFLLTSTGWGGLELNVVNLAQELSLLGVEIDLITQDSATIYKNSSALFSNTLTVEKNRKYFDFKTAKKIAQFIQSNQTNVLLVFDNKDLDMAAIAKRKYFKDIRIIYFQQMQIGINKKGAIHTKRFKQIDAWVTPLEYLKDELGKRTKFDLNKVSLTPIGIDFKKYENATYSKTEARTKLGMNENDFYFGIIGRIDRKKGQLIALKGLQKFHENGRQPKLLIFGSPTINDPDGEIYHQELLQFISDNKLTDFVEFAPFQPDVALFYHSIDCFIMASESETYGMVTVEAMASGTPMVGANTGGTPDLLGQGKFGLVFDYMNTDHLFLQMSDVYVKYSDAEKRAKLARENVFKNYGLQQEAADFYALIKKLDSSTTSL